MQKKLVDYTHLFLGEGMSVAQFDAMKKRVVELERENSQLKKLIRRQADREKESTTGLHTRH